MNAKQDAINQLTHFNGRFDSLRELLRQGVSTKEQKERARTMLGDLKSDLESACKKLAKLEGKWTDYERRYVEPALRKCSANLTIRRNTTPGPSWDDNLYYAQIDVSWALHALKAEIGKKG